MVKDRGQGTGRKARQTGNLRDACHRERKVDEVETQDQSTEFVCVVENSIDDVTNAECTPLNG